jgi:hypothetical protein
MATEQDLSLHRIRNATRPETRAPGLRHYVAILAGGETIHPRRS